jgi:hypothetical protein
MKRAVMPSGPTYSATPKLLSLGIAVVLAILSSGQQADALECNAYNLATIEDIQQSPEMELAFVLTASQDQFANMKSRTQGTFSYEFLAAPGGYKEAQERARDVAQATKFDYRSSFASNYFAQHLISRNYANCIESDRTTPGVRIWLNSRQGDYILLMALWIGSDNGAATANNDSDPRVDGGLLVSFPATWQRGKTEEIVIKKTGGNSDVFLGLRVGGQSNYFIVVKDPPKVTWRNARVLSPTLLRTSSHGPNPGCSAGQARDCINPTHLGGSFVAGTAAMVESSSSDPGKYNATFSSTPNQICVVMTQSTGACEVSQTATGRLSAIERYPEAQE